MWPATSPPAPRTRAARPRVAGSDRADALRRARPSGRAQPLAGDAKRRLRRRRTRLALRAAARRARPVPGGRAGAPGVRLQGSERDDPAQARRAGGGGLRVRGGHRDRGREHAHLRGRPPGGREHRRGRPPAGARATDDRSPDPSAGRGGRRPRGRVGPARGRGGRGGDLEPHA